jgi:hypothetical protein
MFLDCPAYLDEHGARRCRLPRRGVEPVRLALQRRASRSRHDQMPFWPLVQRANRIPHLRNPAKARGWSGLLASGMTSLQAVMTTRTDRGDEAPASGPAPAGWPR